jgi:hypothetical protein
MTDVGTPPRGLLKPDPRPIPREELFGHVILVEGYNLPSFTGCHALVALRDKPGTTVAVLTSEPRLQTLLEQGLATHNPDRVLGL